MKIVDKFCRLYTLLSLASIALLIALGIPGKLSYDWQLTNRSTIEQITLAAADQSLKVAELMPPAQIPQNRQQVKK